MDARFLKPGAVFDPKQYIRSKTCPRCSGQAKFLEWIDPSDKSPSRPAFLLCSWCSHEWLEPRILNPSVFMARG